MSIINAIGNLAGGGLKDLVLGVLDRIKLYPEEMAKIQLQLDQNAFELQKMQLELEAREKEQIAKEIEAASANIRAEAQSGDKYTARARPTFLYLVMLILGWNYIAVPLFNRVPLELPEPLFWLFGSAVLGYTGARTWEKVGMPKSK
jgi:hypothetical protein